VSVLDSGCSLVGLAVDASKPPDTLAVDPCEEGLAGKNVLVALRDGDSFAGVCQKTGRLPEEIYRSRFARWQETLDSTGFFPSFGDTLHVALAGGQKRVGLLQGFTRTCLIVLPSQKSSVTRQARLFRIPYDTIDTLRTPDGSWLEGRGLQAWLDESDAPRTDAMLVRTAGQDVWLPLEDISTIQEVRQSYEGFRTGAIADAIGLAAALVFFTVQNQ
jgi:hypothetical protein